MSGSLRPAVSVALTASFHRASLQSYKGDKDAAHLLAFLDQVEKPFAGSMKSATFALSCEDQAFVTLCGTFVSLADAHE